MEHIDKAVNKLLLKFNGIRDPQALCELLGYNVIYYPFHEEVKGIFVAIESKKYIGISTLLPWIVMKFTLGHELGHAILHRHVGYHFMIEKTLFVPNKFEREANMFALKLLFGDLRPAEPGETIEHYTKSIGIPAELDHLLARWS